MRRDQILNHPRAKDRPKLAAYLADHCTELPTAVAVAALTGSMRDLEGEAPAITAAGATDHQRQDFDALASNFYTSNAALEPVTALPDPEEVFARRGGAG